MRFDCASNLARRRSADYVMMRVEEPAKATTLGATEVTDPTFEEDAEADAARFLRDEPEPAPVVHKPAGKRKPRPELEQPTGGDDLAQCGATREAGTDSCFRAERQQLVRLDAS